MKDKARKLRRKKPPPTPMERHETVRREIMEVLEGFGPMSARELSAEVSLREKDVYGHLEHIRISIGRSNKRLKITPAVCRKCGFVFTGRTRLTRPGKCPGCRGTAIDAPLFSIE